MGTLIATASPAERQKVLDEINERRNTLRADSSSQSEPKKIEIHTLGWRGDHSVDPGEVPSITIYTRVFIDGVEVPQVSSVETTHGHDFGQVKLTLFGEVEVITHDRDSWVALG